MHRTSSGKNRVANVVLPDPFGPATMYALLPLIALRRSSCCPSPPNPVPLPGLCYTRDAMKKLLIEVVLEKDRDGYFAYCPTLQGCYTQGKTYEAGSIPDRKSTR